MARYSGYWPSLFLQGLAYCSGLAAVAAVAAYLADIPQTAAVSYPVPQAQWSEVDRPFAAFALTIPEAGETPASYAILRHRAGGRKDVLTLGEPATAAPYLRVEIYRPAGEIAGFAGVERTISQQAAALKEKFAERIAGTPSAQEMHRGEDLDSKFGPFALVDFAIASTPRQQCRGFQRVYNDPQIQIAGMFCQDGDQPVERSTLTCALDRLTLVAAGNDPKTAALFAQAEQHRIFCNQRSTLMAPTPKYPTLWKAIEQKARSAR